MSKLSDVFKLVEAIEASDTKLDMTRYRTFNENSAVFPRCEDALLKSLQEEHTELNNFSVYRSSIKNSRIVLYATLDVTELLDTTIIALLNNILNIKSKYFSLKDVTFYDVCHGDGKEGSNIYECKKIDMEIPKETNGREDKSVAEQVLEKVRKERRHYPFLTLDVALQLKP